MRKPFLIIIYLLLTVSLQAQFQINGAGISAGIGQISGNSAPVTSLAGNLFFDFSLWFSNYVEFRTGILYARKIEYFLPENREGRYYPFIKSFSLKGVIQQKISGNFFMEEGAGIIYLNDRTFSDTNVWEPGVTFSVLGGIDFTDGFSSGVKLGLGLDYGITFTKTNASFSIINLQMQYRL